MIRSSSSNLTPILNFYFYQFESITASYVLVTHKSLTILYLTAPTSFFVIPHKFSRVFNALIPVLPICFFHSSHELHQIVALRLEEGSLGEPDVDVEELCEVSKHHAVHGGWIWPSVEILFLSEQRWQSLQVLGGHHPNSAVLLPSQPGQVISHFGDVRLEPRPIGDHLRVVDVVTELEDLHKPGHVVTIPVVEPRLSCEVLHHGGRRMTHG